MGTVGKATEDGEQQDNRPAIPELAPIQTTPRLCRPRPSEEELEEIRRLYCTRLLKIGKLRALEAETGVPFKKGPFTNREKQLIKDALSEFLIMRGLTHQDFMEAYFGADRRHRKDKRFRSVFSYIAQQTEGRPVVLVYEYLRRTFDPCNLPRPWTPEEEVELRRLLAIHGPAWTTIGKILGRSSNNVRVHCIQIPGGLANKDRLSKGAWTPEEDARLKWAVKEVRGKSGGRPCWAEVAKLVGTRQLGSCLTRWQCLQLERTQRRERWTEEADFLLLDRLREMAPSDYSEIVWRDLAQCTWPFPVNATMLRDHFWVLQRRVPNYQNVSLDVILETLLRQTEARRASKEAAFATAGPDK